MSEAVERGRRRWTALAGEWAPWRQAALLEWLAVSAEVLERHPEWIDSPPEQEVELCCTRYHRIVRVQLWVGPETVHVAQVIGSRTRLVGGDRAVSDGAPAGVIDGDGVESLRPRLRCTSRKCRAEVTWTHARLLKLVAGAVEAGMSSANLE